jgi:RNA polymerase sigma-70 factor (ECF subfamily)
MSGRGAVVDEPDPQVVAAARRGDTAAFEQLVRRYQPDVWRLSFHLVHDRGLADDVTQDAFVRAFRFLRRYRGDARFTTWLFAITRNCALDELRRSGRRKKISDLLERQPHAARPDQTTGIEVREALAALPVELREPIVLIDMFGCSYKDVASMMKLPEGTVKSRVHRGREVLVESLKARSEDGTGEV